MTYRTWFTGVVAAALLSGCGASIPTSETTSEAVVRAQGAVNIPIVDTMRLTRLGSRGGATSAGVTVRAQLLSDWYSFGGANIYFCNRWLEPEEGINSIPSGCTLKNVTVTRETSGSQITVFGAIPASKEPQPLYVYALRKSLYSSFTAIDVTFW